MYLNEDKSSPLEAAVKELNHDNFQLKEKITLLAKEEIEKREDLLNLQSAALEAAANGILISDAEGKINWVNKAFTELTGYSKDDVYNKTPQLLKSEAHDKSFYKNIWDTITSGKIWSGELVNKKKDGTLYNEEMTITPVKDKNGEIKNFIAIKKDISKRKENERNLLINQTSVDQSALGIIWVNSDSELIYANQTFFKNMGYSRKELTNLVVADIDPNWPDKEYFNSQIELLRTNSGLVFESINKRKDGSNFPVNVSLKLINYENEEIIVAYIQDLSENRSIREIENLLITSKDLDELLVGMHENIKKVIDAPNCYIALLDSETEIISFPYFADEFDPTPEPRARKKGSTEYVINSGKASLLNKKSYSKLIKENEIEAIGTTPNSWIGVPLFINSVSTGVLVVQSYSEDLIYTEKDRNWLISIANLVATAIGKKNTEEIIKENEEKFKAITNSTKDAIITLDENLNTILWNRAAKTLFGYTESEALNKSIFSLIISKKSVQEAKAIFEKVTSIGKDFKGTFEILTKTKDNKEFTAELSVSSTEINKNWYITGIWRNLSHKNNLESATEYEKDKLISSLGNELALIKSNYNILNTIIEILPHHIYVKDCQSRFIKVNKSMANYIGYNSEEKVLGKTDSDFFDSKVAEIFLAEEKEIMRTGKGIVDVEHERLKNDGSRSWATKSKFPLYNSEGKSIGTFGITIDLTDRKKAENELKDSYYKFRKLIENSTLGIIRLDEDGEIIMANPAMVRMLDYSSEIELITQKNEKIYSSIQSKDKFLQILRREEKVTGYEDTFIKSDKSLIEVRESAWAVKDRKDKIIYYEVIIEDITEQNQILKILHESEFKYRMLIDKLNEAVFLMIENKFELVNSKFLEICEIKDEEELYDSQFNFIDFLSDESKKIINDRKVKLKKGEPVSKVFELSIITLNDTEKEVEISVSNLNYNGKTVTQGVMRDLTEIRKQETQIRHLQKMESIGTLAAGIAHEINTPSQFVNDNLSFLRDAYLDIQPIINFSQEIENDPNSFTKLKNIVKEVDLDYLQEEIPMAIDQSLDGVKRIAKIVGAMRDFSHSGPKDKISADLHEIINNSITLSKNAWKYIAEIEKEFDEALPAIICQPNDINQVIVNMIVNSAHAMEAKFSNNESIAGKIKIKTINYPGTIEVNLSDNGSGMSEKVKKRIFDPFYTTKDVGKGTGQGLAIAYDIVVTKHGGNIEVESEEEEGTTFRITLPKNRPVEIIQ